MKRILGSSAVQVNSPKKGVVVNEDVAEVVILVVTVVVCEMVPVLVGEFVNDEVAEDVGELVMEDVMVVDGDELRDVVFVVV
eukprot:m.58207 g.58207  ORF g.58207 m.58207 type:complete len:82 (+) comp11161_c1_seq1:2732-2977(+)